MPPVSFFFSYCTVFALPYTLLVPWPGEFNLSCLSLKPIFWRITRYLYGVLWNFPFFRQVMFPGFYRLRLCFRCSYLKDVYQQRKGHREINITLGNVYVETFSNE